MSAIVWQFEHSLALPFFRLGMKTDLFQCCGHWWVFQICWHIECSTFTASSFRIWSSSAGIPSPALTLFVVMLPKAHLTSHSRMSGSRWVITPLSLSVSLRLFPYSSICACHLYKYLLLLLGPYHFFLYWAHLCMKCSLRISNFLEEISRLSHSVLLFSSISLHWSLRKAFLSLLDILWNSSFRWVYLSFSPLLLASLYSGTCKASSHNDFAFLHFFFLGVVLITASCTMTQTFVHSSSGTLSVKSNPLNLFVTSIV